MCGRTDWPRRNSDCPLCEADEEDEWDEPDPMDAAHEWAEQQEIDNREHNQTK